MELIAFSKPPRPRPLLQTHVSARDRSRVQDLFERGPVSFPCLSYSSSTSIRAGQRQRLEPGRVRMRLNEKETNERKRVTELHVHLSIAGPR